MTMNRRELEAGLDRWGGDLGRWPPPEADAARALADRDDAARRLLSAAASIEDHLAACRDHAPPDHLAARISAGIDAAPARRDPVESALCWLTGNRWRPAVLGALLTLAGYLAGGLAVEPVDTELADEVISLAFTDIYGEVDDAQ
jgi:hypothetical protein